ncbi:MAG: hormogonium polysaccharide biosynthesis protein HpsA [Leptolyngbyaceae cyanobacterium]
MLNHPLVAALQPLLTPLLDHPKRWIAALAKEFLRLLFGLGGRSRHPQRGFILPTTVMMLVVVSLAVSAITLRSYERTSQVAASREQRVIYNTATPALDRARSKLEYLFKKDSRMPSGIPGETILRDLLRDGTGVIDQVSGDAYVIPGETRLDLDEDGTSDTAWSYRTDTDEDGVEDATIAYSILFGTPTPSQSNQMSDTSDAGIAARADRLQVRHAPLSGALKLQGACNLGNSDAGGAPVEQGWFPDPSNTSILRKNFQVDVYVLPDDPNSTISTLEFHQDRQLNKGNKWGAWFRNDLELHPGPKFNWNGAMHTEGSLMVGLSSFSGYLISAPESCLYTRDASEITVAKVEANDSQNIPAFEGQVMSGWMKDNSFSGQSDYHLHDTPPITNGNDNVLLDKDRDSVINSGITPADIALDPLLLATQDISQSRDVPGGDPAIYREADWNRNDKNLVSAGRIYNQSETAPYLDDFFRADNRYGPKPRYQGKQIPGTIGEPITGNQLFDSGLSDTTLTLSNPSPIAPTEVGLDGYWERRARAEGLRLIVGERLELGNTVGWGGLDDNGQHTPGTNRPANHDPLEPWDNCAPGGIGVNNNRCHEARQRRMLRDNLATVQATAVYHTNVDANDDSSITPEDWDMPAACLATTVHPGTWQTLAASTTFRNRTQGLEAFWDNTRMDSNTATGSWSLKPFVSNFLTGEGTNGWEYGVQPTDEFTTAGPIITALKNLAYLAGDPRGGAPSFVPVQDNVVHPYPQMSMWGDYSILRRIFEEEWDDSDPETSYENLSPADKATLQSAACTLGMLAYNISYLDSLDYTKNPTLLNGLATELGGLSVPSGSPPEAYIAALSGGPRKGLAQVIMEREQVERDRRYGFQEGLDTGGSGPTVFDDFSNGFIGGSTATWNNTWTVNRTGNGVVSDVTTMTDTVSGSRSLRIRDDRLQVSRSANLAGMTSPTLSFNYRRDSLDRTSEYVTIEISANGSPFTELGRFQGDPSDRTDSSYQTFSTDISGYISADTTIRFVSSSPMQNGDRFWVDNLNITDSVPYASNQCRTWLNASNSSTYNPNLALLCTDYPKFPSLYSLFPIVEGTDTQHGEEGDRSRLVNGSPDTNSNNLPDYIETVNVNISGGGVRYTEFTADVLATDIAVEPRPLTAWVLPHVLDSSTQSTTSPNPTHATDVQIACVGNVCGSGTANNRSRFVEVALKDTALFNGREMMATRVLNLNLELLRTSQNNLENSDHWLPNSGIIYAFREDAVREDEIVRPRRTNWNDCDQNSTYESTSGPNNSRCRVNATVAAENSTDPPLNTTNLISPKSVDYYPDPDRRPFGFRILNGEKIYRTLANPKGMSMVSDNPVYIQGSLNLHQTTNCNGSDSCRLEEFTTKLNTGNYSNFYSRNTLEPKFARPASDLWRPTEILADAVSIISDDFCDGSIADGILTAGENNSSTVTSGDEGYETETVYGCSGNGDRTSFLNQNRPNRNPSGWHRENPYDMTSPIAVSRNGNLIEDNNTEYGGSSSERYYAFTESKPLIGAQEERVNAIIISGLVPSRANQGYGGLHNFPRFLSNWDTLYISGAFLQLNFSNYATAPFEQDAWEVNQNPNSSEPIRYYSPPARRWGYDVGLQYAPAGPIASRFVTATAIRSEFYSEPASDDPYMSQLCRALVDAAGGEPSDRCAS